MPTIDTIYYVNGQEEVGSIPFELLIKIGVNLCALEGTFLIFKTKRNILSDSAVHGTKSG